MEMDERKWLARWSPGKQRDFKQLQNKMGSLSQAFDKLLPIIGLWSSLELGAMHRILGLRCSEVNITTEYFYYYY
jgi:hypothetical protein